MARRKRTRAEWTKVIARYRASGQTAEVFAAKHGLAVSTLRWWSSELRPVRPATTTDQIEVREVIVAESVGSSGSFEIGVGPVVMRFETGTDPGYVTALVTALIHGTPA